MLYSQALYPPVQYTVSVEHRTHTIRLNISDVAGDAAEIGNTDSVLDENGVVHYNLRETSGAVLAYWRRELGWWMAKHLSLPLNVQWRFIWPSNYVLFTTRTSKVESPSDERKDAYLKGTHTFRSVHEVVPHFYWVIAGGGLDPPNQSVQACHCKYCLKVNNDGSKRMQEDVNHEFGLDKVENQQPKPVPGSVQVTQLRGNGLISHIATRSTRGAGRGRGRGNRSD